jgi:hypothetical protein
VARLPSDAELGGISNPSSGRPIASIDVTGYARGAAAIGGGVADLGKGITTAATQIADANIRKGNETDALEEARANSNFLIKTKQIKDEYSTASDDKGLEEKYKPQLQSAYDESASMITNPRKRELWTLKAAPTLEEQSLAVGSKVYDLQKTKAVADTLQRLDDLRNSALSESDPAKRGAFIAAGQGLITGLKDAGYIDAVTEQKNRKQWTENYAIAAVSNMPPEERIKTLAGSVQGKRDADRIGGIENATGNPAARAKTSSAMGDFQFTNQTWLDTIKLRTGRTCCRADTKAVLDLARRPQDVPRDGGISARRQCGGAAQSGHRPDAIEPLSGAFPRGWRCGQGFEGRAGYADL